MYHPKVSTGRILKVNWEIRVRKLSTLKGDFNFRESGNGTGNLNSQHFKLGNGHLCLGVNKLEAKAF